MYLDVKSFAHCITSRMNIIYFIFLLSIKYAVSVETVSNEITDTKSGMSKSTSNFRRKTLLQCANECAASSDCKSILWDSLDGTCHFDSYTETNSIVIPSSSGSMKPSPQDTKCRFDKGFELRSYGGITRCMYISGPTKGVTRATEECHGRGGRLFKANSLELLELIRDAAKAKGLTKNWTVIVGLSDVEKEDHFIWSDGQPMTTEERKQLFKEGEPNNNDKGQDENCVTVHEIDNFNDRMCSDSSWIRYACEMID